MKPIDTKKFIQNGETWKLWVRVRIFDSEKNVIEIFEAQTQWHKERGQLSLVAWSLEKGEDLKKWWVRETLEEVWIEIPKNTEIIEHSWKILLNIFNNDWLLINEVLTSAITIILPKIKPNITIDPNEVLSAERIPAPKLRALFADLSLNWEIRPWAKEAFLSPEKDVLVKIKNARYMTK